MIKFSLLGLSIHTFHGNFFVRSTDLLSLPNVNPDAGYAVQMSVEESLTDTQLVSFQSALLYTSSKGKVGCFEGEGRCGLLLLFLWQRHITWDLCFKRFLGLQSSIVNYKYNVLQQREIFKIWSRIHWLRIISLTFGGTHFS